MITAVYFPRQHRLEVRGHAGYGAAGEDIVCAAVSALICTLGAALEQWDGDCVVQLESGDAVLELAPTASHKAQTAMETVCLGLELLAQQCGAYVCFERKGEEHGRKYEIAVAAVC